MYNYYVAKRKQDLEEEKKKVERRESVFKEKRKKMINSLYQKYENRVKDFVLDMVHSPIKVKDYMNPIESTREELMREEDQKIQGRRGFIFKGFKTEKERIEEHMKSISYVFAEAGSKKDNHNHSTVNKSVKIKRKHSQKKAQLNNSISQDKQVIIQPQMRYKPRTDLERIFEAINKNSFGRVNKNVIDKQLRGLDLNYAKKKGNMSKDDSQLIDYKTLQTLDKINKYDYSEDRDSDRVSKSSKNFDEKRKNMNVEAKNLMSDLHYKTHFKGATVIANRIELTKKKSIGHKDELFPAEENNQDVLTKPNPDYIFDSNGIPQYKKNFNPYLKTLKGEEDTDMQQVKLAYKLAFCEKDNIVNNESGNPDRKKKVKFLAKLKKQKDFSESILNKNPLGFFQYVVGNDSINPNEEINKRDDEKILVDDIPVPRNRMDLIAQKVLNKCNFNHQKKNNNIKPMRSREGKLMMTQGMSIKEFENKFNL